jgi:hypothetical protein
MAPGDVIYSNINTAPTDTGSSINIFDDYPTNTNVVAYDSGPDPTTNLTPITLVGGKTYLIYSIQSSTA